MAASVPTPEALLERACSLSALARALAAGDGECEDAAQDALLASLERGRGTGEDLPGWLARKMRSLAHRARRSAARRRRREALAARPEAVPSAAELVERAWLQRTLVEAVVALDEPYRSVVLLRYFEDLPPREIARVRGVPVRTVQTQLARGLAQLRARLDRQLGPRTWAVLAAPLVWRAPTSPLQPLAQTPLSTPLALGAGGIAMSTQLKLVLAASAAVAFGALALVFRSGVGPASPRETPEELSPALAGLPQDGGLQASELSRVAPEPRAELEPAALQGEERPGGSLSDPIDRERDLFGEVVDTAGRPIPTAAVSAGRQEQVSADTLVLASGGAAIPRTSTDDEGHFRLRLEPGPQYRLVVEHPLYATARLPDRFAGEKVRVVLGAAASFYGRVLRAVDGSAVAGAGVSLRLRPEGFVQRMEQFDCTSDELGNFRLDGLAGGTYEVDVDCPQDPQLSAMALELSPGERIERDLLVPEGLTISGHVFEGATGRPLHGAEVYESWWFRRSVRTELDGSFVLRSVDPQSHESVVSARASGYATERVLLRKGAPLPADLRIELGPALSAVGRVLDSAGVPLAGARVSAHGRMPFTDEPDGEDRRANRGIDEASTSSDADGRFRLEGLSPRARHTLTVRSPGAGALIADFPERESAGGEVDLGHLALWAPARLRGRVVDKAGDPISSAWVMLEGGDAGRNRFHLGTSPAVDSYTTEQRTRVDDLGRFSATDLGPGTWNVSAICAGIEGWARTSVTLREGECREDLELVLDIGSEESAIAGRVVGPDGQGVFGVHVQAWSVGAVAEGVAPSMAGMNVRPDGTFRLGKLTPGTYRLETLLWPSAPAELCPVRIDGVHTGDLGVVIELPRRALIRGQVVTHAGTPCPNAIVQIDLGDDLVGGALAIQADAEGRFELSVPAGERVDLVAHELGAEGLRVGRARSIPAGTEGVVLRLEP